MKKLNDYFPSWMLGTTAAPRPGVFTLLLSEEAFLPWLSSSNTLSLDLAYHSQRNLRFSSPALDALGDSLSSSDFDKQLPLVIRNLYGPDWNRLWAALELDYNPIEPYKQITKTTNVTEGSSETTDTGSGTVKSSSSGNTDVTDSGSSTITDTISGSRETTDSSTANVTEGSTGTKESKDTTTSTGTDTLSGIRDTTGSGTSKDTSKSDGTKNTTGETTTTGSDTSSGSRDVVNSGTSNVTLSSLRGGNDTETQSGLDTFVRDRDISNTTKLGSQDNKGVNTLSKSGTENTSRSLTSTHELAEDTTSTEEKAGETPYTETITEGGKQRVVEKGGTIHSVWGFDSDSPVNVERNIAVGGDGSGDGNGDGSTPGDGHVTDTIFDDRTTTKQLTGSKVTNVDHHYLSPETVEESIDSKLSFEDRQDSQDWSETRGGREDTSSTKDDYTDTTTYGKKIVASHDETSSGSKDITDASTSKATDTSEVSREATSTINNSVVDSVSSSKDVTSSSTEKVVDNSTTTKELSGTSSGTVTDTTSSNKDTKSSSTGTVIDSGSSVKESASSAQRGTVSSDTSTTDTSTSGTSKVVDNSTMSKDSSVTGNIGVFTSQNQLVQEYELRKKHFFDAVFADLDRLLTLPIY